MIMRIAIVFAILFSTGCATVSVGPYRVLDQEYAVMEHGEQRKMLLMIVRNGLEQPFVFKQKYDVPILIESRPSNRRDAMALFHDAVPPRLLDVAIGRPYGFMGVARELLDSDAVVSRGGTWWIVSLDPVILAHSNTVKQPVNNPPGLYEQPVLLGNVGLITQNDSSTTVDEVIVCERFPLTPRPHSGNELLAWGDQIKRNARYEKITQPMTLGNIFNERGKSGQGQEKTEK